MAIKKIHKIDANGEVTFIDTTPISRDKGTEPNTTAGTQDDCLAYGYKFLNSKCYAFNKLNKTTEINRNIKANNITKGFKNSYLGSGNVTEGSKNIIIGHNNRTLQANENIIIGKNLYTNVDGGITYGSYNVANRARNIIYTYEGTTTNATATELFNNTINRFFIDENYEAAYFIKASLVSLNAVSNTCAQHEQYIQFKFVGGSLTRTAAATIIAGLGDVAIGLELDAVAGTPDYIRLRVTGRASETFYHNVKLDITEVRYG